MRVDPTKRLDAIPTPEVALTALVLLNLMWGGSIPATKLALESFGPFTLASTRLILAAGLFLPFLRPVTLGAVPRADIARMAALGVLGFTATQVFQALGTGLTSGSAATVLASTSPLFIAIIAPTVLREHLRPISMLGIAIALVGVATITSAGLDNGPVLAGSWVGNGLVLLSSLASASNTVFGKPVYLRYPPLLFCGVGCVGGALASLPFAVWELSAQPLPQPSAGAWALVLYLAVLVTFVGFLVWFWGLRALPAARAGALMFLQPLFGLVLAMALLGDRPTPVFLVGCALVVAGVYLAAGRATGAARSILDGTDQPVNQRARDLRRLPKAHLHLHLEGSMRPATLVELSRRYGAAQPDPPDGSMETFLRLYRAAASVLRTPDDYVRLVDEVVEDAAADGVVWVEPAEWAALAPPHQPDLPDADAMLQLLLEAGRRASARTGVGMGLMVSSNRTRPPEEAVALARLAVRYAGRGVVSFGLADNEMKAGPEPFAEAFAIARSAGLLATPHAGEHGGPDSVRGALDALGARRVQHGVRSAEDPELVRRLADEGVCLDVCPTSNVQLNVVESLAAHPLPALLDAGVTVSLNADDPLFFGSGVLAEYELAREHFGLGDDVLARIAASSLRASGASHVEKAKALADIDAWLAT